MTDEFRSGFAEGFRAVKGGGATVPPAPPFQGKSQGRSSFQMGVAAGVETALGKGFEEIATLLKLRSPIDPTSEGRGSKSVIATRRPKNPVTPRRS